MNFKSKIKSQNPAKNQNKKFFKNLYTLFNGIERTLDAFENAIFPIKKLKVQVFQTLAILISEY